ncbi:MAG: hypothetical protein HRT73_14300 [Flavobacteriales bacterium]|nr:hypothetical protein [Flavobacteriales bacterium]
MDLARNIPGLVIIMGRERFHERFWYVLEKLASHTDVNVRKLISAGIHEIIKVYETPELCKKKKLDKLFLSLLNDEDHSVCGNVMKNIVSILKVLTPRKEVLKEESKE